MVLMSNSGPCACERSTLGAGPPPFLLPIKDTNGHMQCNHVLWKEQQHLIAIKHYITIFKATLSWYLESSNIWIPYNLTATDLAKHWGKLDNTENKAVCLSTCAHYTHVTKRPSRKLQPWKKAILHHRATVCCSRLKIKLLSDLWPQNRGPLGVGTAFHEIGNCIVWFLQTWSSFQYLPLAKPFITKWTLPIGDWFPQA